MLSRRGARGGRAGAHRVSRGGRGGGRATRGRETLKGRGREGEGREEAFRPQLLARDATTVRPSPMPLSSSPRSSSTTLSSPPPPPPTTATTTATITTTKTNATSSPPTTAIPSPRVVGKLITEELEFNLSDEMGLSNHSTEFLVVGLMGPQGTGKSTLATVLANATSAEASQISVQTADMQAKLSHGTTGIDLILGDDGLLLLDTQPLFSPSILLQKVKAEAPLPPDIVSYENLVELQSLQLATFLFSVCHVVVLVLDRLSDTANIEMLKNLETLKFRIPDPSQGPNNEIHGVRDEFFPDIVTVFTKVSDSQFAEGHTETLERSLDLLFAGSRLQDCGIPVAQRGSPNVRRAFLLPLEHATTGIGHESYEYEAQQLRWHVINRRRPPWKGKVTPKEWLSGAQKVWEHVRKSSAIADYNRTVQKLGAF